MLGTKTELGKININQSQDDFSLEIGGFKLPSVENKFNKTPIIAKNPIIDEVVSSFYASYAKYLDLNTNNLVEEINKQQELLALNRKEYLTGVKEMSGAIAHHLNQPLQCLSTFAELYLEDNDYIFFNNLFSNILVLVKNFSKVTEKIQHFSYYPDEDPNHLINIFDIINDEFSNESFTNIDEVKFLGVKKTAKAIKNLLAPNLPLLKQCRLILANFKKSGFDLEIQKTIDLIDKFLLTIECIMEQISNIKNYKTIPYLNGKIIDLEKSSM